MRLISLFGIHAICASLLLFSTTSCEKSNNTPSTQQSFVPNFTLARTNSELAAIQADPRANIIRSREELEISIASNKSPLAKLSKSQQEEFISKIVFRKGVGAVSFYYGTIASQLSYEELAQVVAAFGLDAKRGYWGLSQDPAIRRQFDTGGGLSSSSSANQSIDDEEEATEGNHVGYACVSKGNCYKAKGWICMSGC